MAAELTKLSFLTADGVQAAFRQGWIVTGWTSNAKPTLPAGMVVVIAGYPYQVTGGDLTPSGTPADGPVFIKVTPNTGDSGATALAAFVTTWPATWSETYNGWYDGSDMYLNAFMTKSGADYGSKGYWPDFRTRAVTIDKDGNIGAVDGVFSGEILATENLIPKNTTSEFTVSLSAGVPYIVPAGIYWVKFGAANAVLSNFINGGWSTTAAGANITVLVISDGTNTRLSSDSNINMYFRKFA